MVRSLVLWLLIAFPLFSEEPASISAEVQWDNIYENQPIEGFVSVTHNENAKVDEKSFTIGGKPLKVTYDKEVEFSPNSPITISIYNFTVPGMPVGLQLLPEISVKVGGKVIKAPAVSFQVLSADKEVLALQPFLKLETIGGESSLYPGSRTQVGYRYVYNTNIELTEEYLPLLDAANLRKIGDKDIKDTQRGHVTIHTILQNVEAIAPGTFKYGPSVVIGNAYQESGGRRVYIKQQITAEAPIVTIHVKDFPLPGKPPSFNGAVGQFTFKVGMETANQVRIGDKVTLRMEISGSGQLDNVKPPDLCCQPGYSGLFKTSDLPPVGKIVNNTKTFEVDIYPLSTEITSVPPIEFSFFNPAKEKYETSVSSGIPIKVLAPPSQEANPRQAVVAPQQAAIQPNYVLSQGDMKNKLFGSFWVLAIIPLGLVTIFFQYALQQEKSKLRDQTSKKLFEEAIAEKEESAFYAKMMRAFQLRLYEKGYSNDPKIPLENMPDPIQSLFAEGDERFSAQPVNREEFIKQAKDLFKKYS